MLILGTAQAFADVRVIVAADGSDRLVIGRGTSDVTQMADVSLMSSEDRLIPLIDVAKCATFGSKHMANAVGEPFTADTVLGQYNAVNLWLGRTCGGKSDMQPTVEQGRAWIEEIERVRLPGDKPFIDIEEMMAFFLVLGAPGVEPQPDRAMAYIRPKAEEDPGEWGIYVAYLYQEGIGSPIDLALVKHWIDKAADAGSRDALLLRAQDLELGIGRERDEAAAFELYAGTTHYPTARFRAGLMLLDGRGVAKDACKAKEYLEYAARHAFSPVMQARPHLERIAAEKLCP